MMMFLILLHSLLKDKMLRLVIEQTNLKMMKKLNVFKNHVIKSLQIIIKIKKKMHKQIIVTIEAIKIKKIKIKNNLIKIFSLIKKITRIISNSNVKINQKIIKILCSTNVEMKITKDKIFKPKMMIHGMQILKDNKYNQIVNQIKIPNLEGNSKMITEAEVIDKGSMEKEVCEELIEVEAEVTKTGGEVVVVILEEVIEMITNVIMLMKMNTTRKKNQIYRNQMNQQNSIMHEGEGIIGEKVGGIIIIRKIKL